MDEYIKVKDLVDMLEQRLVFQETHGFYRDAGYTSRFIESIADIPHIDVAPKSEWISVNDRLPEEDVRVLVCLDSDRSYTKIDADRLMTGGLWVRWFKDVTHWMYLPEPPTEKEN